MEAMSSILDLAMTGLPIAASLKLFSLCLAIISLAGTALPHGSLIISALPFTANTILKDHRSSLLPLGRDQQKQGSCGDVRRDHVRQQLPQPYELLWVVRRSLPPPLLLPARPRESPLRALLLDIREVGCSGMGQSGASASRMEPGDMQLAACWYHTFAC